MAQWFEFIELVPLLFALITQKFVDYIYIFTLKSYSFFEACTEDETDAERSCLEKSFLAIFVSGSCLGCILYFCDKIYRDQHEPLIYIALDCIPLAAAVSCFWWFWLTPPHPTDADLNLKRKRHYASRLSLRVALVAFLWVVFWWNEAPPRCPLWFRIFFSTIVVVIALELSYIGAFCTYYEPHDLDEILDEIRVNIRRGLA
jgi:hypothetical protein